MSMTCSLLHAITSCLPAKWKSKLVAWWFNNHAIPILYNRNGLLDTLAEALFHKYTGMQAYRHRIKKYLQIREKEVITVVFQVWNESKWKCDSVYKTMEAHPKFNPVIWITDEEASRKSHADAMREKILSLCQRNKYRYTEASDWEELDCSVQPDIVFLMDHYISFSQMPPPSVDRLTCYVRYCFPNTNLKGGIEGFMVPQFLFFFMENESVAKESRTLLPHKGHNIVISGHPVVDSLLEFAPSPASVWKEQAIQKKKLIWAPHWTINNDGPAYNSSTFLQYAEFMRTLAQKYADKLQIAFKPHPTLYRVLCKHPEWGKEKTDSYYAWWAEQSNTQLEAGEYKELFQQSDAMIHDSGSFILEYLLMDKPCMYLSRVVAFPHFNEMNKEALKCHCIGKNEQDIEDFIQQQVINYADTLHQQRHAFVNNYLRPPNGKTAAENIIETILYSRI